MQLVHFEPTHFEPTVEDSLHISNTSLAHNQSTSDETLILSQKIELLMQHLSYIVERSATRSRVQFLLVDV